jgi:lipid A ethanolaminephosphotransferase
LTLLVLTLAVAPLFKEYASLVRNHREIRYLLTPVNYLHSLYVLAADLTVAPAYAEPVGQDAAKGHYWAGVKRPVVTVLVVGETARADHFSLGGYERRTNPRLAAENIVYFSDVSSCGTATRVSLPCMFSDLGREAYSKGEAKRREGLLDVLNHAGIRTVWLDNNAGCKGVCNHTPTWTAAGLDIDGLCEDGECFDAVLLNEMEKAIAGSTGDTVIVLHQNGSHGPAYYRRYPDEFRVFTPDCRSDDFGDCTRAEIVNSYDNTIYYTDWFLAQVIERLEGHAAQFDTAMLYVSDHGESLGEFGLYLHHALLRRAGRTDPGADAAVDVKRLCAGFPPRHRLPAGPAGQPFVARQPVPQHAGFAGRRDGLTRAGLGPVCRLRLSNRPGRVKLPLGMRAPNSARILLESRQSRLVARPLGA